MAAAPIWVPLVAAAVSTDQSIHQAEKQKGLQHRSALAQEKAQAEAKQAAISQQVQADQAQAAANRRQPDLGALLTFEQEQAGLFTPRAPSIDRSKLKLGKPSLLGET